MYMCNSSEDTHNNYIKIQKKKKQKIKNISPHEYSANIKLLAYWKSKISFHILTLTSTSSMIKKIKGNKLNFVPVSRIT